MEFITGEDYRVIYDEEKGVIYFQGIIRLQQQEYTPLMALLDRIIEQPPPLLTLNLRDLEMLNSSGVSILARFMSRLNNGKKNCEVTIQSTDNFSWQKKSLRNLQQLMPNLKTVSLPPANQPLEIQGEGYSLVYQPAGAAVLWQGNMRLTGSEYAPVSQLFEQVVNIAPPIIHLNLRQLELLNSSGVTTLAKFIIAVNKKGMSQLVIHATEKYSWQKKSLLNFVRLMSTLQFEWE